MLESIWYRLYLRNPPLKKCAYYEWAQYLTYLKLSSRVIYYVPKIILIRTNVYNFDGDFRLVRFAIFRNWF